MLVRNRLHMTQCLYVGPTYVSMYLPMCLSMYLPMCLSICGLARTGSAHRMCMYKPCVQFLNGVQSSGLYIIYIYIDSLVQRSFILFPSHWRSRAGCGALTVWSMAAADAEDDAVSTDPYLIPIPEDEDGGGVAIIGIQYITCFCECVVRTWSWQLFVFDGASNHAVVLIGDCNCVTLEAKKVIIPWTRSLSLHQRLGLCA